MRILMVTGFYPPSIGGIEQHVRHLSRELEARGHSVAVATLWNHGWAPFEQDGGVRIYRLRGTVHRASRLVLSDPARPYAPPFPDPELVRGLACVVARERPQVVHGHDWLVRSFLPLKRWSGARLVVSLHDYGLACPKWTLLLGEALCSGPELAKCAACAGRHYGLAKGLTTALANRLMGVAQRAAVDLYLPVSQAVARGNRLAGSALRYRVIPNFVPDDVGTPRSLGEPLPARLPRDGFLLFVGALRRYKGVHVLLEAYASLSDAPPLVLIGSAWRDSPMETGPHTLVLRNWPHDAVMEAWRRCLLGLAPSVWPEPCPTVVMEAMACGRAVIASRIGGLPELVVHGETGLLVPPGEPAALRVALQHLLDHAELRADMGRAARQRVAQFQASSVVPRIEQAYREVLAVSGLPSPKPAGSRPEEAAA